MATAKDVDELLRTGFAAHWPEAAADAASHNDKMVMGIHGSDVEEVDSGTSTAEGRVLRGKGTLLLRGARFLKVALNVDAHERIGSVGADGDALLKLAGEFSLTVEHHLDVSRLAGGDGRLGECGDGAAARCCRLLDDEGFVTGVGEGEFCGLGLVFRKAAEVVARLAEAEHRLCRYAERAQQEGGAAGQKNFLDHGMKGS